MPGSGGSEALHGHDRDRGRFLLRLRGIGDMEHQPWSFVAALAGGLVWVLLIAIVMRVIARDWTEIQRLRERNGDDSQKIMARLDRITRLLEARGGQGGAPARPLKSK